MTTTALAAPPPEYTIDVCDSSWNPRWSVSYYDSLRMVDRLCDVGAGAVNCPATPENRALLQPGSTVLVRRDDGSIRHAGLITPFSVARRDASETVRLTWVDTLGYLAPQQAWPNPTTANGQGPNEHDEREGTASTVILGYVAANVGPGAGWRHAPGLVMGRDLRQGAYLDAPVQARYDNLLDLIRNIAIPSGVTFEITTVDRTHTFSVRQVQDLSADVVFSADLANLGAGELKMTAPEATRVIALGKGEGTARLVLLVTTPESLAQETYWGRPFVYVHDSSSSENSASLQAEAVRQLAEKGESVEATFEILPGGAFTYGVHYRLGDFVSVVPTGLPAAVKPVREVQESVSASSGWSMKLIVGDYRATASTGAAFQARQVLRVVDALKRNR